MKTNTKKVINILLTLAMIFSMVTAFGGIAMAAPVLSDGEASIAGDDITVTFESTEAAPMASLRAWSVDDGVQVLIPDYLNQFPVVAGANSITFPVDVIIENVTVNTKTFKIVVAAAPDAGTIEIICDVNGDKTELEALLYNVAGPIFFDSSAYDGAAKYDEDLESWSVFWLAYLNAYGNVYCGIATQAVIDETVIALQAAIDALQLKTTQEILSLQLDSLTILPLDSFFKNTIYELSIADPGVAPNGQPYSYNLEWKVNNTSFATVLSSEGPSATIKTLNKNGMLMITVTDTISGLSAIMVVMII